MSDDIASIWNARYTELAAPLPAPAQVLVQGAAWLPLASPAGSESPLTPPRALDLACGRAANGEWLAERGFKVSAWDISCVVVDEIRNRQPRRIHSAEVRDVTLQPPELASFDVIIVCRFLDRNLCSAIQAALKPGGILFYQTFTHGLSNPDFLLGANELLSLFEGLHVLEYHEPEPDAAGKAEARLIARRILKAV